MSYSMIPEEKIKEPVKKIRDHRGELNPHFGHVMQPASRDAIARSQKSRFEFYRKAAANIMTEERIMQIVRETCSDYLAKNSKLVENNEKKIDINL